MTHWVSLSFFLALLAGSPPAWAAAEKCSTIPDAGAKQVCLARVNRQLREVKTEIKYLQYLQKGKKGFLLSAFEFSREAAALYNFECLTAKARAGEKEKAVKDFCSRRAKENAEEDATALEKRMPPEALANRINLLTGYAAALNSNDPSSVDWAPPRPHQSSARKNSRGNVGEILGGPLDSPGTSISNPAGE